jgi:A/G-specific adenine glycosylase
MNYPIIPFQTKIRNHYRDFGRDLPWRREVTPYGVLVSEVMLQQTQVSRVLGRWQQWLDRFPGFERLAGAEVAEVLEEWQGMGYNRRALWLREAARRVVRDYDGALPHDPAVLVTLPGIGPNTAGSIAAFAYEAPVVFIETNIRRVFIYEFFGDQEGVSDAQLRPLIEAALDRESPREWYWALMDYGADLVKRIPNPNRRSKHYVRQSKFEGSVRQLRGEVLRRLLVGPKTLDGMQITDERLGEVLRALEAEGFIEQTQGFYCLMKK